ncbi:MAG: ATP-dependent Clp protease proteolytic subunit [Acidimicrobiales bacterium]
MTMIDPPEHPDVPYPFVPARPPPRREEPVVVPMVDLPSGEVEEQLFERRRVLVSGPLDRPTATRLCAQLMALDGRSGDAVEVVVNSPGGALADVSPVLDVIELMRAPVGTTCVGTARGTAAVLVACGTGPRRAARHASISVRCDHRESFEGSAEELAGRAVELESMRQRIEGALVEATGRPAATIADELDHGPLHDASGALALGLVDEVVGSTGT